MVTLTTEAPEVNPLLESNRLVNPISFGSTISNLSRGLQDTLEVRQGNADTRALSAFVQNLTSLQDVNDTLQEDGQAPLSDREASDLETLSRIDRKLNAVQKQRRNTMSGAYRRVAEFNRFIAENPRLTPEALKYFSAAVGRDPGTAIRELESDPMADKVLEADQEYQYQLGINKEYAEKFGNPSEVSPEVRQRRVEEHRRLMSRKAEAAAVFESEKARREYGAFEIADNFTQNIFPIQFNKLLSGVNDIVTASGSLTREQIAAESARIDAQMQELMQSNAIYLGSEALSRPEVQAVLDIYREGSELAKRALSDKDAVAELEWKTKYWRTLAEEEFLTQQIRLADGTFIPGYEFAQRLNVGKDLPEGFIQWAQSNQQIASAIDWYVLAGGGSTGQSIAERIRSNDDPKDLVATLNSAKSLFDQLDRGEMSLAPATALNILTGTFFDIDLVDADPEVQEAILDFASQPFINTYVKEKLGSDVHLAVAGHVQEYADRAALKIAKDLGEISRDKGIFDTAKDAGVEISVIPITETQFSLQYKPTTDEETAKNKARRIRKDHNGRLSALIRYVKILHDVDTQTAFDIVMKEGNIQSLPREIEQEPLAE